MTYKRGNTDWLAACTMGISVHWTAQTMPREGPARPFAEAVAAFQLNDFLDAVSRSGSDYVIFTATHALQMLPCPHPVVDSILPGRTTERDLIGELAQGLATLGKKLIIYYNHSCNSSDDPEWERAVGYHDQSKHRFARNLCEIVSWMGERYGSLVHGWWFDSSSSLDPRGPDNTISTDMGDFLFPWEDMTVAAKAGYGERLVAYNGGIAVQFLYTEHQDYWSGELTSLSTPPAKRFLDNGLQWHGWTCLDDRQWVYTNNSEPPHPPLYSDDDILAFMSSCRGCQAPMCFNVIAYQDGSLPPASVDQLSRISNTLRKTAEPTGAGDA